MPEHSGHLREELQEHLPYTIYSVAGGLVLLGLLTFVSIVAGASSQALAKGVRGVFHVFHPLHMLFSAAATTAMFWRHERRRLKAAVIGLVGSVGVCGISDILLPYLSGLLLGQEEMHLHICVLEEPAMILPFAAVGIAAGLLFPSSTHRTTITSHSAHVLLSSSASIMYLIGFGELHEWAHQLGAIFICMIFAVIVPCCCSDIVFPLLMARDGEAAETALRTEEKEHRHEHDEHDEHHDHHGH